MTEKPNTPASGLPGELAGYLTTYEAALAAFESIQERRRSAETNEKNLSAALAAAEVEKSELLRGQALHGKSQEVSDRLVNLKATITETAEALEEARAAVDAFGGDDEGGLKAAADGVRRAHKRLETEGRAYAKGKYEAAKARFVEQVRPMLSELMAWGEMASPSYGGQAGRNPAEQLIDALNLKYTKAAPAPFILPRLPYGLPERPVLSLPSAPAPHRFEGYNGPTIENFQIDKMNAERRQRLEAEQEHERRRAAAMAAHREKAAAEVAKYRETARRQREVQA